MGEAVLVVESDKADMDVESYDEGYLAAIITGEDASRTGLTVHCTCVVRTESNAGGQMEAMCFARWSLLLQSHET